MSTKTSATTPLTIGSQAPPFTAQDQSGRIHTLTSLLSAGHPLILYFYSKDHTPGCTRQACAFRDLYASILAIPATLCGISPDTPGTHARFAQKHNLPFFLLSDLDKTIAQAYGTYVQKKLYGKTHMGIERTTFIITPQATISHIFRRVTPDTHPATLVKMLTEGAQPIRSHSPKTKAH
jgi:peroxiredoxin Q/BCP